MTTDSPAAKEQMAGEILAAPEGHSFAAQRLHSHQSPDAAVWEIALHDVRDTVDDGDGWVSRTVWWVEQAEASWQASAPFCSDASWEGRKKPRSALLSLRPNHDLWRGSRDHARAGPPSDLLDVAALRLPVSPDHQLLRRPPRSPFRARSVLTGNPRLCVAWPERCERAAAHRAAPGAFQ